MNPRSSGQLIRLFFHSRIQHLTPTLSVYRCVKPLYPKIHFIPRRSFTRSRQLNMKSAIVAKGPKVTINDVPIPKPGPNQVLIKVVYSGSNPKDWKRPEYFEPHNSGDDIAGIVEAAGENVVEFKKGDRVAAFHEMMAPDGSFAEVRYVTDCHFPFRHLRKEIYFMTLLTLWSL